MRSTSAAQQINLIVLASALISLSACYAVAEDATPIPEFTGERLYVAGVPSVYESVARTIRDLEAKSPQTYYVVVVKSSGPAADAATRTYAQGLLDAWRDQAKARKLRLDPDRSVIVVAAIDNHQVVVMPGDALATKLGLRGETIDREIVAPQFIPLAKEHEYPQALIALLNGVDGFIAAREKASTASANTVATTSTPPSAAPVRFHGPSSTELAWSIGGSLAAIALMIGALIWLGRRRARGEFNAKLKDYKGKAVAMMDRLDALKSRLKSLTVEDPDFTVPITGETLSLYEKGQDDLRKLWDRWLEVMDVVDKAEKGGAQGAKAMAEADALLSNSKVFDEVEKGAQECSRTMDRLNAAHEEAREAAKVLAETRKEADGKVESVNTAGLPVIPYQPEVDRIAAEAARADEILPPDPLGAKTIIDKTKTDADALVRRASDVVARLGDGKKVQEGLQKLREEVAEHRRKGLELVEDGGNPDGSAARGDEALAALQTALELGDPVKAAEQLAAAQTWLDQGKGVLDSVLKARAGIEKGLPETRRETRRLSEAMSQYQMFEQELKRDFAPSSWRNVAGNLGQARALLETFDRKADEVEKDADPKEQKYLLAARLLGRLNLEQQAVFQLMNAVGDQLAGLKAVREEADRIAEELTARDREVRRFFSQYDHVVGAQARKSLESAAAAREDARRLASANPPDWPSARRALIQAREEFGIAQSQAQSDYDIYQLLTKEYDQARSQAQRVEAFLAGHSEDRVAANQHYRHAAEVLNLVGDDSTRVGNEWPRLLDQVRGARQDLAYSEKLAREDIRLARQAEAEMSEAARVIREGRTFISMGIGLDTRPAESQLNQAESLYRSQEYEQSIRTAGSAIQQLRRAHNAAVQQAYLRQMQVLAQQRRGAVVLHNFGMGTAGGAMIGGLTPRTERSAPPPPQSAGPAANASSSSWSSEASESSW
ncbi:hypothetical protein [Paludisphaera rhizosphaerae]|uniref:hypothetical protein n=1 Tax=Paludisphaera rhizosphaerae TaxID=2711216 RepID=UPI0013EA83FF|nr:hypothetical protein [Paludisphaera rhizosphaerae]